jgi:preprotein translocase subunit SecG
MLSGLLITLDILICLALIGVVLMQRSEGGAFGMGGGPTGLITTRGAGDLLTRTTWILFASFLVVSLTLTLLGAHDKASSSIIDKLKLQHADTSSLNQPVAPPPTATAPAPGAPGGTTPLQSGIQTPLSAPAPQPLTTTVPNLAPQPITRPKPAHEAAPKAEAAPAQAAAPPPVLEAPPPKPLPAAPTAPAPGAP